MPGRGSCLGLILIAALTALGGCALPEEDSGTGEAAPSATAAPSAPAGVSATAGNG